MSTLDTHWPFLDAPNTACFTTIQILNGSPILFVWHYADDNSFVFSNTYDMYTEDMRIVALGNILRNDPSIASIARLAPGWEARRPYVDGEWKKNLIVEKLGDKSLGE